MYEVQKMDHALLSSIVKNSLRQFLHEDIMTAKKIGLVKDMEFETVKGVVTDGKEILVVNLGKTYTAIGNRCTHMGCRLSGGRIDGETIRCPCHGSMFNVRTGEVVRGPAKKPEPTYTVTIENDELFVDL
jgi:nitrite reductase/ring-hydroxylating ferredoxin subunit